MALWVGLGLGALLVLAVAGTMHVQRRRREGRLSVPHPDPAARAALVAATRQFCHLQAVPSASGLTAQGPIRFEFLGPAKRGLDPDGPGGVVVRVRGGLRPPARQISLSSGQRRVLLSLAGAILLASLIGIALAPATKVTSAPAATIVVRGGVPLGGTRFLTYRVDRQIDLTVRSDVVDLVRFHGYVNHGQPIPSRPVAPGHPAHFLLTATTEGSFPVELERHGQTLAEVNVEP